MSNPRTLTDLAANLAQSAHYAHQRQDAAPSAGDGAYLAGYAAALLDTRATVLAMIAEGREVIRTVHEYPPTVKVGSSDVTGTSLHKANPGKFPTGTLPTECVECGKDIKHLPAGQGWVHSDTGMVVG
jgi:hypothetical protein